MPFGTPQQRERKKRLSESIRFNASEVLPSLFYGQMVWTAQAIVEIWG